ncbi:MAG: DUF2231 domain-containing protein [Phycisphaerales bacterium]
MARLFGHPMHPATAHAPIGLWIGAVAADLGAWADPGGPWADAATWALGLGLAFGALAGVTGFLDFVAMPRGDTDAERIAMRHLTVMTGALGLMAISLALRLADAGDILARLVAIAGVGAVVIGGWLGAELVFGHGAGARERLSRNP